MPYSFAAESFHTKKLCSRLSSKEVHFYTEDGHFAFLSPPFGRLGATYAVHHRLIGKPVVDFLLVIIELFSLCVMVEALRANIGVFQWVGHFGPKFQIEGYIPTNHLCTDR